MCISARMAPDGKTYKTVKIGEKTEDAERQAYFLAYDGIKETEARVQPSGYPKIMLYSQDHSSDYHFSIRCVKND